MDHISKPQRERETDKEWGRAIVAPAMLAQPLLDLPTWNLACQYSENVLSVFFLTWPDSHHSKFSHTHTHHTHIFRHCSKSQFVWLNGATSKKVKKIDDYDCLSCKVEIKSKTRFTTDDITIKNSLSNVRSSSITSSWLKKVIKNFLSIDFMWLEAIQVLLIFTLCETPDTALKADQLSKIVTLGL